MKLSHEIMVETKVKLQYKTRFVYRFICKNFA